MNPVTWSRFTHSIPSFRPGRAAHGYAEQIVRALDGWLAESHRFPGISRTIAERRLAMASTAVSSSIRACTKQVPTPPPQAEGHLRTFASSRPPPTALTRVGGHGRAQGSVVEVVTRTATSSSRDPLPQAAGAQGPAAFTHVHLPTPPSTTSCSRRRSKNSLRQIVHEHGGQVYMDVANMNAHVAGARGRLAGADRCHPQPAQTDLCIPPARGVRSLHGGPDSVSPRPEPLLPTASRDRDRGAKGKSGPVFPRGSVGERFEPAHLVGVLGMMGPRRPPPREPSSAILNAEIRRAPARVAYPVPSKTNRGRQGRVAHEWHLDTSRPLQSARPGSISEDIAKRYGTTLPRALISSRSRALSYGSMPTEASRRPSSISLLRGDEGESREEIRRWRRGPRPREGNVLKRAPHTVDAGRVDAWDPAPTARGAAWPAEWVLGAQVLPSVAP